MCLRDQGIDDNNGGIGRVRRARGISNNNRGVSRGRGIHDASEVLETMPGAAGARQRFRGIYNKKRRCRQRKTSKKTTTMTTNASAEDIRRV